VHRTGRDLLPSSAQTVGTLGHIWPAHYGLDWQPMLKTGEGGFHGTGAVAPVADPLNDSEVWWGKGSWNTTVRCGGWTDKVGHEEVLQAAGEVDGGLRLRLTRARVTEATKRSAIAREWLRGTTARGGGARLRWHRQLAWKREESSGGALDSLN
jgi:hypothetical protein